MPASKKNLILLLFILQLLAGKIYAQLDLSTNYFKIHINNKGFITSMKNVPVKPFREFSAKDKLSPLMCLYNIYYLY